MRITIADRFRPFSHLPGTICVLPGTRLRFYIYPTTVIIFDDTGMLKEVPVETGGPVTDFTVQLDLEKSRIRVWGKTPLGLLRYSIYRDNSEEKYVIVHDKQSSNQSISNEPLERLSLGFSKSQDWEMVKRRGNMEEVLPIWFYLGQQIAKQERAPCEGTAAILHDCRRAIIQGDSRALLLPFKRLFRTGFDGILTPRKADADLWGYALPPVESDFSALALLSEGAELIRSLFFSYNDGVVDILPALPVELHSGRFIHLKCGTQGLLDMEWTKKSIRRMVFHAKENGAIRFALPREIKQFRLRTSEQDRGQVVVSRTPIEIAAGGVYYLDRFEK